MQPISERVQKEKKKKLKKANERPRWWRGPLCEQQSCLPLLAVLLNGGIAKQPPRNDSWNPSLRASFYFCSSKMASLCPLFAFFLLVCISSPSISQKVTLSLYYETLCPYCADFIVNHLVKVFDGGLTSIVDLRMIPWGNAFIQSDGTFVCQVTILLQFFFFLFFLNLYACLILFRPIYLSDF